MRILVSARSLPNQWTYESLQGREGWPFATPRRCHAILYQNGVRVHRMSPVFTLLSRAEATIVLIEPASASPTSLVLHA